jgi:hypothetical protein
VTKLTRCSGFLSVLREICMAVYFLRGEMGAVGSWEGMGGELELILQVTYGKDVYGTNSALTVTS